MALVVKCHNCGSEDIVLLERVTCRTPIQSWRYDEDRVLQHEFSGGTEIDWNSQRPDDAETPYECLECGTELGIIGLEVEENEG